MRMKTWACVLGVAAASLAAGCRQGVSQPPGRATPPPPSGGGTSGRWQVIAFNPSEDTDADGAILLDTATGQSYVLCDYATAWCKLDRPE